MARVMNGQVVSDRMDKTVSVVVTHQKRHRLYHKQYQLSKKFLAHDEQNQAKTGDLVQISECRPLSRRKRWQVTKVIQKAKEMA